jgi:4-hydroxymandelate synthase
MTVQDIAYVELFVLDKVAVVDRLVADLGFARVADSVQADRSSVLLRQGEVLLVVTSGWGTRRFVSDHGDGVFDIALSCADVAATVEAAQAAGARTRAAPRGGWMVSGFGSVWHTLVPTAPQGVPAWPSGRQWITTAGSPATAAVPDSPAEPTGRILRLDHMDILLTARGLADYAAFCEDALGFTRLPAELPGRTGDAADSAVLRIGPAGPSVALTASAHRDGRPNESDEFLERNGGPGVHRLGFRTGEIRSEISALQLVGRRDHDSVPGRGTGPRPLRDQLPDGVPR